MKSFKSTIPVAAVLAFCLALGLPTPVSAKEIDSSVAACLKAWGEHPFGKAPQYRTMGPTFKLFGIGSEPDDTAATGSPALVLIEPSFNLFGVSSIDLMNPNGWYCLRTTVSIVGKLSIRAHCKARLASNSAGVTAVANNGPNRGFKDLAVTSVSSLDVERPCN